VDGSTNRAGNVTKFCNLWLTRGGTKVKMGFYVTNLGRDRLILGHPWFRAFNPTINWETNQLEGDDVTIETAGYRTRLATPSARNVILKPPGDQGETEKLIPPHYQRHWTVFSEEAAQRFPPARDEDHGITLKPGAPSKLDCKIYRQTEAELKVTKEFIEENLAKGYITEANSPYASPMFYRAKKDGKLRPIIDYRVLNDWTVRDVYPLPLIGSIIDHLQGKTLFTKLDLRWGFNNIRIKEEDRWKAAFKTPYGMYEPAVMFFGMCNSPATFCRAMARMFRPLTNKYPTELFVYVDDILIATTNNTPRHREIVNEVLDLLAIESYFLRPAKCTFEQARVEYLGVIVEDDKLFPDPKKTAPLRDWPRTLSTVKEVRSILGVLGYQRPFIANYANIARPLVTLTKKDHPFRWTEECTQALNTLIDTILTNPALRQPDLSQPFFLQVDASAFATGAILTQKDDRSKHVIVSLHSQTFNDAERNYDIHDRELLAVYRGLTHHRHLLLSSPFPVTIRTDHKNLEYYRHPHNINRRVARYLPHLADYNFTLEHIPGSTNKADPLSRRPDYDNGSKDNADITVLPPHLFIHAATLSSIDDRARACQLKQQDLLKTWSLTFPLKTIGDLYWHGDRLAVVDDLPLRRGVISLYHDSPTAGHPGISNTTWAIARDYWWPNMKQTITDYIKGCHLCQSRKNNPTKPKPPPFPITSDTFTLPFTSIAMDFIVKLPVSDGFDSILTITDTFSKASIFIPCNETIDAANTALLYATYVLPHYGLPTRIISDRDPRFMASIIQELLRILSIQHNPSTAYHPQTDGQSERTNQRLEQYIRIFTNYHQTDWRQWLPLAQYALNAWPNATTKKAPFELIMGHIPRVHQTTRTTSSPPLNDRLATIDQARKEAADALRKAQSLEVPSNFTPYYAGDRVWLEARNLNTTHPSAKLAPRRYGPFLVTAAVSRTSYRLKLPQSWKIHNVFHATLLTPYKETPTNGSRYQEPVPELIDGQPEWEVEQILGARKRRQQLQYLVRWKGFSDAHDSWEPLAHINADQLIKEFYQNHPNTVRSITYKDSTLPSSTPITIRRTTMSNASTSPSQSPANNPAPAVLPPLTDSPPFSISSSTPDSPRPLIPEIPPTPRSPSYHPESPTLGPTRAPSPTSIDTNSPSRSSTEPAFAELDVILYGRDFSTPDGYSRFDRSDPNHHQQGAKIPMPDGTERWPHYIKFAFDYVAHSHYVLGLRDDLDDSNTPYGWPLKATPFIGPPIPHPNNNDLTIFDETQPHALAVDISLFALDDKGVTADVDRLRDLPFEEVELNHREEQLNKDRLRWHAKKKEVRQRLVAAQAITRLHPYLKGNAPIPDTYRPQSLRKGGVPISTILQDSTAHHLHWLPMPQLHDEELPGNNPSTTKKPRPIIRRCRICNKTNPSHNTWTCPEKEKCMYCGTSRHRHWNCPNPHVGCRFQPQCLVPYNHRYNCVSHCPYTSRQTTYDEGDMDGSAYDDVNWEVEDRGD